MTDRSLDERIASRVGRALCAVAPTVQRILDAPVRRDGLELEPELFVLSKTQELRRPSSVAALRKVQNKLARVAGGARPRGVVSRDLSIPSEPSPIPARLYEQTVGASAASPLIVFYHGGGFVFGDLGTHDAACAYLARRSGAKVLAVDYRLAPEHRFPAAVEDARAALRWAHLNARALGADPHRVGVAGDSAGGNLAAAVAQIAARDGGPAPACQVLLYPGIDRRGSYASLELFARGFYLTSEAIAWFQEQYVPDAHAEPDPRYNPLFAKDLTGLAPALVVTAGFDPLRDEGEAYAAALATAGNAVTARRFGSLVHGFFNLIGMSPACREAVAEVAGATRVLLSA